MKLVARIGALVLGLLGATLAVGACSNQGEGERCDQNASNGGNDDCQDGLICWSSRDLLTGSDLCCPPNRAQATTAACQVKQGTIDAGGIPDSSAQDGAPDTSTTDSAPPADSSSDAPAESASDAGAG